MAKYMLCQLSIILDRDAGKKMFMTVKAVMFTLFTTVGFACYFGITGASYDADCEYEDVAEDVNDGDAFQVCAGTGATIAIVAFALTFLAGVLAIVNSLMQKDDELVVLKYSDGEPMCCSTKMHFIITSIMVLLCVGLGIVAMCINWTHFEIDMGNTDEDYDGDLMNVKDFDTQGVTLDYYGYDCIAVDPCDIDDDTTVCKTFEPLMNAGQLYMMFEIINLVFLLLFVPFLVMKLCYDREVGHPIINHTLPHMAWVFHLIAIICFAAVSNVKFEMGDCSNDDTEPDEAYDVCVREGPVLAIV